MFFIFVGFNKAERRPLGSFRSANAAARQAGRKEKGHLPLFTLSFTITSGALGDADQSRYHGAGHQDRQGRQDRDPGC